jgi:copper chaperone CopZ
MNTIKLSFTILTVALIGFSCGTSKEEAPIKLEVMEENKATVMLSIEGMVCASGCAKGIEKELSTVNGIVECKVDFDTENATVVYDKTKLGEQDIIAIIEDLNDGQYSAGLVSENEHTEAPSDTTGTSSSSTVEKIADYKGKSKTDFILPLLLNYILNNIAG